MPKVKHWVGYDEDGRPIHVPSIDLGGCGWFRIDGYASISPFFTVFGSKEQAASLIKQAYGRDADVKPYMRVAIDVVESVLDRLKSHPQILLESDRTGSGRLIPIMADKKLRLHPFSVDKNRDKSTLTERRKVFKYIKAIIEEESSWNSRAAVYEKSHDARTGFILYYDNDHDEEEES